MALATGVWSLVTFKAFSNAAWTAYADPPVPSIPSSLMTVILAGSSLYVFCVGLTGSTAQISWYGGGPPFEFDVSVLNTDAAQTTEVTTIDGTGEVWYSVRPADGSWQWFGDQIGIVNSLTLPGSLGAFIS